jgi:hypothetical protein
VAGDREHVHIQEYNAMTRRTLNHVFLAATLGLGAAGMQVATAATEAERSACEALVNAPNLTLKVAEIKPAAGDTPEYCYVRGTVGPSIGFHVQLPLPDKWNGRFLKWGDGAKDGDLDFANHRLAEGYAVANSNMGHDSGAEPGASFAFNNRQAEIDFGYRAVHVTVNAAKTLIRAYYGRQPAYSYFEGCSTGGREGLMEAQRYPFDFDGISAGAPVMHYQELNAGHTWLLQQTFKDNYSGNLAHDTDGDGSLDSLEKLDRLVSAVLAKCDANDGIEDGVIDNPLACDFVPRRDLAEQFCPAGTDAANCFTPQEIQTIEDFYAGPHDSHGVAIDKGRAFGSEAGWEQYIPHAGNRNFPGMLRGAANGHTAYLLYENDPGAAIDNPADTSQIPNRHGNPPEHAWWEFDIDDLTAGKADFMKRITNADDPNLERFLIEGDGKLLLWHGWSDGGAPAEPTVDYYEDVVKTTFDGNHDAASERARLFMFPGMGHCSGGNGPDQWDALAPLVDWVENGAAPDFVVARHLTDGVVDNERRVCVYPQVATYTGPARGRNDSRNWVAENFACR